MNINIKAEIIHRHSSDENKLDQLLELLLFIKQKLNKMAADLTELEQKVTENGSGIQSAILLLNGLKALLDAAGTDPVKLKALSDSIGSNTQALAEAVVANTPAEPPA